MYKIKTTISGKKLLQNMNPLRKDFIEWFLKLNIQHEYFKLSTYCDGEPVFLGLGLEIFLRDYLKEQRCIK